MARDRDDVRTDLWCIHGFSSTWHNWDPITEGLGRHHRVHVARLAGHADGPPLPSGAPPNAATLADQLERDLDAAGVDRAHLVGNSLGGWLALELAARGRALSVTALAPGLGWEPTGPHLQALDRKLAVGRQLIVRLGPAFPVLFRFSPLRKALLKVAVAHGDQMSREDALHLTGDMARCTIADPLRAWLVGTEHQLGPIACPVRIAWSEKDQLLPRDPYGARFGSLVPHAEQMDLLGVGHVPTYDDPELVVRTILEVTLAADAARPDAGPPKPTNP